MNVYRFDIKSKIKDKDFFSNGSIMLLGQFRLFHNGHLQLLNKAKEIKTNEKIGIFIIEKKQDQELLTLENKLIDFETLGFDFVVVAEFDFEFKSLRGDEFINYLNNEFNVSTYVTGQDFKFGKDRKNSAKDIETTSNKKVIIIDSLLYNGQKISSSEIIQMNEFGEYNIIDILTPLPLTFDVNIEEERLIWTQNCSKPHYGNYYFKLLIDSYWYHGIINFSIDKKINYKLINFVSTLPIFDQKTKIKIINIERIIVSQRFDNITNEDIEKTKLFFSKNIKSTQD